MLTLAFSMVAYIRAFFRPRHQPLASVRSKLKCPVFVASEMSGFKVVPSPIGLG